MRYTVATRYFENGTCLPSVFDKRDQEFVETCGDAASAARAAAKWNQQYEANEKRIAKMRKRGDFSY